jgi:aminomethyltransferase
MTSASPDTDSPDKSGPAATERFSPLHSAHVAAGASFTDFAGWQMPVRYSSDLAEHHAVRQNAGLFDLSHMAEIRISGPQAGEFLDHALAGQLSAIQLMQAKYSLLLNSRGGIIDDLVVYRTGESEFLVVANAGNHDQALDALTRRAARFDVTVTDESDATALIAVQGPNALAIVQAIDGFTLDGDLTALRGEHRCSSPAPDTPAKTASSSTCRTPPPSPSGTLSSKPAPTTAWCPPDSPAATRSASKRECRCTATN